MKVMLTVVLHDGEREYVEAHGGKMGDQTPEFVYALYGVPIISFATDDGKQWRFPKWTDGIGATGDLVGPTRYLDAVETLVRQLASDYDGDPRIEGVWVGAGLSGEGWPYPWDKDGQATNLGRPVGRIFLDEGVTPRAWETYVSRMIGLYKRYFIRTPLFFSGAMHPRGPQEHQRVMADDAVKQGLHLAAHYLAAEPDTPYFALADWQGYFERWSWVRDYAQDAVGLPNRIRLYVESGETYTDESTSYWQVLMGLDKRADYLGAYPQQSRNPHLAAIFGFFNDYAGKTLRNTPGIWIAFRKESAGLWQPQKDGDHVVTSHTPSGDVTRTIRILANYGEWLTQLDPDGTTVGVWEVGGKEGKFARRTDVASERRAFYLNVDDNYMGPSRGARFGTRTSGAPASIRVVYFDRGTGSFEVRYDGVGGSDKLAGLITKADTDTWQAAVFELGDAYFGGRMSRGADLRIVAVDEDVTLHMVEIRARADSP